MRIIREQFIESKYTENKPTRLMYEVVQRNGLKFPAVESYEKALEMAHFYNAPTIIERRVIRF